MGLACITAIGLSSVGLSFADNSNETSGSLILDGNKKAARSTTESVGGGYWTYDSWVSSPVSKSAFSTYVHDQKYHSSYAEVGSAKKSSGRKSPGSTAHAEVKGAINKRAIVKWSNNA